MHKNLIGVNFMKRIFKKIILSTIINLSTYSFIFAAGDLPTFDLTNWLNGIDNLYVSYDMVTNSITQLENQYKQIQMALEQAKSIDWSNIKFDGDLDISDEIKSVTSKVNRLTRNAKKIEETLTTPSIDCGFGTYSIADLCGKGADGKNIVSALGDMKTYMSANMQIAISQMTNGLSEEQKKAIWKKYGLSPENYLYIQQAKQRVMNQAGKVLAKAQINAGETKDILQTSTETILENVYSQLDSEGNITAGATRDGILKLSQQMINGIIDTKGALENLAALQANNLISVEAEKEAKEQESQDMEITDNARRRKVPDSFKIK